MLMCFRFMESSLRHVAFTEVVAALLDTQAKRLRGLLRAAALWKRRGETSSLQGQGPWGGVPGGSIMCLYIYIFILNYIHTHIYMLCSCISLGSLSFAFFSLGAGLNWSAAACACWRTRPPRSLRALWCFGGSRPRAMEALRWLHCQDCIVGAFPKALRATESYEISMAETMDESMALRG